MEGQPTQLGVRMSSGPLFLGPGQRNVFLRNGNGFSRDILELGIGLLGAGVVTNHIFDADRKGVGGGGGDIAVETV